jgi:hypothetical protein
VEHTVGERSLKNVLFWFLTLRFRKSVLRLAVRGNRISDRVVFSQGVPVFEKHRMPSAGSRWDIRWESCREKTWFLCIEPGIMEKSFDS